MKAFVVRCNRFQYRFLIYAQCCCIDVHNIQFHPLLVSIILSIANMGVKYDNKLMLHGISVSGNIIRFQTFGREKNPLVSNHILKYHY